MRGRTLTIEILSSNISFFSLVYWRKNTVGYKKTHKQKLYFAGRRRVIDKLSYHQLFYFDRYQKYWQLWTPTTVGWGFCQRNENLCSKLCYGNNLLANFVYAFKTLFASNSSWNRNVEPGCRFYDELSFLHVLLIMAGTMHKDFNS